MSSIPEEIVKFIYEHIRFPAAVIGCRASNPQMSFECCEYDIAIFCNNYSRNSNFLCIGNYRLELIYFPLKNTRSCLRFKDMILLKDYESIFSSPLTTYLDSKKCRKLLQVFSRKRIIDSLFCYEKINDNLYKRPILSSMWLKIAAYTFLEGILALYGFKSSPLHELNQIRHLAVGRQEIASGINTALESIGVERAARSVVSRSLKIMTNLNQAAFQREALEEKANYLLSNGMVADLYHYLGKIALKSLFQDGQKFDDAYMKVVQMSLDLNTDPQQIQRLHGQLLKACKDALRINEL